MILVCGSLADLSTELFCARLEHMRASYRLLNLGLYPDGYRVDWFWDKAVAGQIQSTDWTLELADVSGVFVRFIEEGMYAPGPTLPPEYVQVALHECQAGLSALFDSLPCPVANSTAKSASNQSKPYQALLVRAAGLQTPPTLVTSDPQAALAFYEQHRGEVIFKSLSGVRSIVRLMESHDLGRLHHLRQGPAQFQAYLSGDNIRVHTVGERLFATRIRSSAIDYRYARRQGAEVAMEPTELPEDVAASCQWLATELGLLLSGIDLKQTADGAWYCFEINPAPHFAFYEQQTGQPISTALVELLSVR